MNDEKHSSIFLTYSGIVNVPVKQVPKVIAKEQRFESDEKPELFKSPYL